MVEGVAGGARVEVVVEVRRLKVDLRKEEEETLPECFAAKT
jgi:hypothetical protein